MIKLKLPTKRELVLYVNSLALRIGKDGWLTARYNYFKHNFEHNKKDAVAMELAMVIGNGNNVAFAIGEIYNDLYKKLTKQILVDYLAILYAIDTFNATPFDKEE